MDQKNQRTSQSVGSILQVTKNMIQETDNFYDYYINKDNSLYHKQLPLLIRKSKLQALVIRNKENKKQSDNNYPISLTKDLDLLDNIRNAQIRSKKLPPLCPFYNEKGELVRSVVKTSRVCSSYKFDNERINVTLSGTRKRKILKKIFLKGVGDDETQKNDFEKIENDYFNFPEEEYNKLIYDENDIFGKKEYYLNIIKKYIENFINKEQLEENKEYKKEKTFDKNRKKKKIILTLDSINVQIYDQVNDKDSNDEIKEIPIFEYNLPFEYLPFFYYKGEEKFKIFLSKIIEWDNINKKFILNENQGKIFQDILANCTDFNKQIKVEKKRNSQFKSDENIKQVRGKFNATMGNKKGLKKETLLIKLPTTNFGNKDEQKQNFAQTMAEQIPNNYLSNLNGDNRYNVTDKKSIYPSEKENNYINYNVFEFLWLTPNNTFKVSIKMPLISIKIPKNNICVNKYIDFDLLFFLYENEFKYWDFYLAKYLMSFKSFRTLLEDINSVNESWNKRFYLTHPRIRAYSFNNFKFVNIVSIKHSDILENLIDGLMTGSEKDNKIKTDKSMEKEKNNNNTNEQNERDAEKKEKPIQYTKAEEKIQNSTLIMKSFIAIVRFVDLKTMKAQEFKIYFNFAQFIKFQKLENFIDKVSLLIKFIDINYLQKKVSMNYKSLDSFDENEWIKDFKQYNINYLNTAGNSPQKETHQTFAEFSGMSKNTSIQIEIYHPISLVRTLSDNGHIKTEKNILSSDNMTKTLLVEKDDIKDLSRIFYDNYGEEKSNNINANGNK